MAYKNGGGAFLIPYVIMLILVGVPIFFLELAFGQFASLGPITIWTINPLFKGLGFSMLAIAAIICVYYNVIIAYCFFYFFASMTSSLPWITCDNEWNTCTCKRTDLDLSSNDSDVWVNYTRPICHDMYENGTLEITNLTNSPSAEYFKYNVLQQSSGLEEPGKMAWQLALCLLLSWTAIFAVLIKGVQSLGKIVYFTAIFPYVVLTILLVRGVTLPGSYDGIIFYLNPEWERLKAASVWNDAATQIFFSLSACSGGLITMASYNKFNNNCMRDAFIVPVINCLTSFYSGFVIFSVLGFMAAEKGTTVDKVADQGPGLVFIVYPEALARMDVAPLWSILFFLMMLTLGFSSTFAVAEAVITAIIDEFPTVLRFKWRSLAFRFFVCMLFFLLGLPMCLQSGTYLHNLVDASISGYPLLVVGVMEFVVLNWIYGYRKFARDIEMMLGRKPFYYFPITWVVVAPAVLFGVIVFRLAQADSGLSMGDYQYPDWAISMGWLITAFPIVCIPAWFIFYLLRMAGFFTYVREAGKHSPNWGPYLKSDWTRDYANRTGNNASTETNIPVPGKAEIAYELDDDRRHSKRVEAQQYDNPAYVSASDDVFNLSPEDRTENSASTETNISMPDTVENEMNDDRGHSKHTEAQQYDPPAYVSASDDVMPVPSNTHDTRLSPEQEVGMPEVEGQIKPVNHDTSSVDDKEDSVLDERL